MNWKFWKKNSGENISENFRDGAVFNKTVKGHKFLSHGFKFMIFFGISLFIIVIAMIWHLKSISFSLSGDEQIIVGVASIMFFLVTILMIGLPVLVGIGMLAGVIRVSNSFVNSDRGGKHPIIFQVPSNHVWVLRNAFYSKPGNPLYSCYQEKNADQEQIDKEEPYSGYEAKGEGYRFRIPFFQIDEGIYNLDPKERSIETLKVNSRDQLSILVDLQTTTKIKNPIRFSISMEGNTVEEKEVKRKEVENSLLHTATNRACRRYTGEELQALICHVYKDDDSEEARRRYWSILRNVYDTKENEPAEDDRNVKVDFLCFKHGDEDEEELINYQTCDVEILWKMAIKKFTPIIDMRSVEGRKTKKRFEYFEAHIALGDEIKTEIKNLFILPLYGIEVGQVGVKNVITPDDVNKALQREKAAKIELRAAPDEANAIKKIIDETGANATVTTVAQMVADAFRGRINKK